MSDTITTYTKLHINPLKPQPEKICIEDIAHALSLMTRAGGHFPVFYSVAQHSIHCCQEAIARNYPKCVCLACLLHDASEAYLADITSPVKQYLTSYLDAEKTLQNMIFRKFLGCELTEQMAEQVKSVDSSLFYYEFLYYMDEVMQDSPPFLASHPVFEAKPFCAVEKEFLEYYLQMVSA